MHQDLPSLLQAKDVADILGCTRQTVYEMVRCHKIPHVRLGPTGRIVRFRREAIDKWLEDTEVAA